MRPIDRLKELKSYADPILERVFDTSKEMPQVSPQDMMCINNYIEVLRMLGPDFIKVWEILVDGREAPGALVDTFVDDLNKALNELEANGRKVML